MRIEDQLDKRYMSRYLFVEKWTCPKCGRVREVGRRAKSVGKKTQTYCYRCMTYQKTIPQDPDPKPMIGEYI